jgi:hypothetical protein
VREEFDRNLIELRIAQAYADLLCASGGDPTMQSASLLRIEDHEIRMFVFFSTYGGDEPLFWIELFDHVRAASINTCACRAVATAADVFEEFCSEAGLLESERRKVGPRRQS